MVGISHAPSLINLLRVAAGDCLIFKLQNLLAFPPVGASLLRAAFRR
ncbi:hypothetical protein J2X87_005541 [Pseudomonas synxantha]|uniref:Uncharacterized protein n=1 Tax=Pseudomonas synxantha TaxID=47883 RepID=A0ACC6JV57_9PSED|nr:hypothetical protein [Pseudomonas synxantha]